MPRPPLGPAAKKKIVSVRITPAEEAALIRKYGSPTKALRTLINHALREKPTNA